MPEQSHQDEQPDLFVSSAGQLLAEIRRHGGGTPPRFVAPDEDADMAGSCFCSRVAANDQPRDPSRSKGEPRTVRIRVVDIGDLGKMFP